MATCMPRCMQRHRSSYSCNYLAASELSELSEDRLFIRIMPVRVSAAPPSCMVLSCSSSIQNPAREAKMGVRNVRLLSLARFPLDA